MFNNQCVRNFSLIASEMETFPDLQAIRHTYVEPSGCLGQENLVKLKKGYWRNIGFLQHTKDYLLFLAFIGKYVDKF